MLSTMMFAEITDLQTYQVKSVASQVHDWVVYRLGGILGSVGHKVKIHKITVVGSGHGSSKIEIELI